MNSEIKLNHKIQNIFICAAVFFPCEVGMGWNCCGANLKLKIALSTPIITCLSVYLNDKFEMVKAKLVLNTEVKYLFDRYF